MKEIIKTLLEQDILTVYSKGVYTLGDNVDYTLMIYDAEKRLEGRVAEIWDNCRDVMILADDADILVKYNQFNILTMIDNKDNTVIDSAKIVWYFT